MIAGILQRVIPSVGAGLLLIPVVYVLLKLESWL